MTVEQTPAAAPQPTSDTAQPSTPSPDQAGGGFKLPGASAPAPSPGNFPSTYSGPTAG